MDTLEPSNITGSPFSFCSSERFGDYKGGFPTLDNYTLATFSCLDTDSILPGIANIDTFGEFKATISHCGIALASAEYVNGDFGGAPSDKPAPLEKDGPTPAERSKIRPLKIVRQATKDNNMEDTVKSDGLSQEFTLKVYRMKYLAEVIDQTLYSDSVADFLLQRHQTMGNRSAVIEDIGKVVGEYVRSSSGNPDARNGTGMAWAPQPFIKVEWVWLVLPLLLVILSVLFLVMTAMQSGRRPYLYKTSLLAATLHGLEGWSAEKMKKDGERQTAQDFVERAKMMEARLVSGDGERVRFVRQL